MAQSNWIQHWNRRILVRYAFGLLAIFSSSCSVTYYDNNSQTVHVFGLTHVTMRVPAANAGQVVIHQVNTYGISAGTLREGGQLSVGYSEQTILDLSDDKQLCLLWPNADLINVKINEDISDQFNVKGVCDHVE